MPPMGVAPGQTSNAFLGVPLKDISLVILVLQNSAFSLLLRYSRTLPSKNLYLISTAVVMGELVKGATALCLQLWALSSEHKGLLLIIRTAWSQLYGKDSGCWKMALPSVLYFIQNNLQYQAATYLDAATYQVTCQLKILTTALCTVIILHRSLSAVKWLALVVLTIGVAFVQLPPDMDLRCWLGGSCPKTAAKAQNPTHQFLGVLCVVGACALSGLAGVYFEKIVKGTAGSIWVRNVQLSTFSIIPGYLIGCLVYNGAAITENGFFQGYSMWTWLTIMASALGGLVVAVVVKYADNILKGFATSISIIVSAVVSVFLFDFALTTSFAFGTALVIAATYLYGTSSDSLRVAAQTVLLHPEVDESYESSVRKAKTSPGRAVHSS